MVASPVKIAEDHSNGADIVDETNSTDAVIAIKEAIKRTVADTVVVSTDGSGDAAVDNEEPPIKTIKESDNGNEENDVAESEENKEKVVCDENAEDAISSNVVDDQEKANCVAEEAASVEEIESVDEPVAAEKLEEVNDD